MIGTITFALLFLIAAVIAIVFFVQYNKTKTELENKSCPPCPPCPSCPPCPECEDNKEGITCPPCVCPTQTPCTTNVPITTGQINIPDVKNIENINPFDLLFGGGQQEGFDPVTKYSDRDEVNDLQDVIEDIVIWGRDQVCGDPGFKKQIKDMTDQIKSMKQPKKEELVKDIDRMIDRIDKVLNGQVIWNNVLVYNENLTDGAPNNNAKNNYLLIKSTPLGSIKALSVDSNGKKMKNEFEIQGDAILDDDIVRGRFTNSCPQLSRISRQIVPSNANESPIKHIIDHSCIKNEGDSETIYKLNGQIPATVTKAWIDWSPKEGNHRPLSQLFQKLKTRKGKFLQAKQKDLCEMTKFILQLSIDGGLFNSNFLIISNPKDDIPLPNDLKDRLFKAISAYSKKLVDANCDGNTVNFNKIGTTTQNIVDDICSAKFDNYAKVGIGLFGNISDRYIGSK